jgi:hypothetical protein
MVQKTFRTGLLLLAAVIMLAGCKEKKEKVIMLENPTHQMLLDEPVVITRVQMEEEFGKIPEGKLPVVVFQTGETLPTQLDDLTGDGQWDEMVFLVTIPPHRKHGVNLVFVDPADFPVFEKRTNIRMAKIENENYIEMDSARRLSIEEGQASGVYQMEGPGWENDVVGFRNYFDARNGMDIFGKFIPDMVLDRVGINEDYHFKQDWGQDILRVGTSLGAGSLAIEKDGQLYRVAPEAEGTFEIVTEGPVRSILRLKFNDWEVAGQTLDLVHDIYIYAGKWYYSSTVYFPGLDGDLTLVTGITTIDLGDRDAFMKDHQGKVTTVATFGPQAYDYENLGLAVLLDNEYFSGIGRVGADAPDINNTVLVKMNVNDYNPVSFRFYSGWELSFERFATEEGFMEFIEKEADKMANPLVVSFE